MYVKRDDNLIKEICVSSIIAGRFQTFAEAKGAAKALFNANVKRHDLSVFYVDPPGQHDVTPIGGDYINADPGARKSTKEAVQQASASGAGLTVGIVEVALPIVGTALAVVDAVVGAYNRSLAVGLRGAGDREHPTPPPRQAGVLAAACVEDDERTQRAVEILSAEGAKDVEIADGTSRDGEWKDFDPVATPRLIHWPVGAP